MATATKQQQERPQARHNLFDLPTVLLQIILFEYNDFDIRFVHSRLYFVCKRALHLCQQYYMPALLHLNNLHVFFVSLTLKPQMERYLKHAEKLFVSVRQFYLYHVDFKHPFTNVIELDIRFDFNKLKHPHIIALCGWDRLVHLRTLSICLSVNALRILHQLVYKTPGCKCHRWQLKAHTYDDIFAGTWKVETSLQKLCIDNINNSTEEDTENTIWAFAKILVEESNISEFRCIYFGPAQDPRNVYPWQDIIWLQDLSKLKILEFYDSQQQADSWHEWYNETDISLQDLEEIEKKHVFAMQHMIVYHAYQGSTTAIAEFCSLKSLHLYFDDQPTEGMIHRLYSIAPDLEFLYVKVESVRFAQDVLMEINHAMRHQHKDKSQSKSWFALCINIKQDLVEDESELIHSLSGIIEYFSNAPHTANNNMRLFIQMTGISQLHEATLQAAGQSIGLPHDISIVISDSHMEEDEEKQTVVLSTMQMQRPWKYSYHWSHYN